MKKKVIVIGAGASGLMCAVLLARNNYEVTILERMDKIGKKLLATGNGKCNFTNLHQEKECYRSGEPMLIDSVLEQFTTEQTIKFFQELGIVIKSKSGYLYPYSETATAIVEVFKMELERLNVAIKLSCHVNEIKKSNDTFIVYTKETSYRADAVVLSSGGKAGENLGSDGSGYEIAKHLGHSLTPIVPALVALHSNEKFFKQLAGIRTLAKVTLFVDGKYVTDDTGELQLTSYGISGIPVFQVSRYASLALLKKRKVVVELDFLPHLTAQEVVLMIGERITNSLDKTMEEFLIGWFPPKMIGLLLKNAGFHNQDSVKQLKGKEKVLADAIKTLKVLITQTNPFSQAQVCAGGINSKEVNHTTLESKLVKGLYFTGEILDVDGICGGYNLQWAWSSAAVCAKHLSLNKSIDKIRLT